MIEFSATLKQPLTMEELEKITDSELEGTTKLFIKTPKGKVVTFIKVLEEKPREDCISKEDLREPKFIVAENDYEKGWNDALDAIYENAPSIRKARYKK